MHEHARRLQLLSEASTAFAGARLDLDSTFAEVTRLCAELIGDTCVISLLAPGGEAVTPKAYYHPDPAARALALAVESFMGKDLPLEGSVSGYIVRSQRPCIMPGDVTRIEALATRVGLSFRERYPTHSLLGVPLRAASDVLGVLMIGRNTPGRPYGPDDQLFLQAIADRAGLAVQNAMLFRAQVEARQAAECASERSARLQAATAALAEVRSVAQACEASVEQCRYVFRASTCSAYLISDDRRELHLVAERGLRAELVEQLMAVSLDANIPATVVVRERTGCFFSTRAAILGRFPELARYEPLIMEASVVLPLMFDEHVLGILGMSFMHSTTFAPEDRELAQAIAQQCALAIDRAMLRDAEQRTRERATFLAEASKLLGSSMDGEAVLQQLARLAVPCLADWCVIDLVGESGPRQVASAHDDPARLELQRVLREKYAPRRGLEVMRTGRPLRYETITDELLRASTTDDTHLALLRQLNTRSIIVVPLIARGQPLGALTLVWSESDRHYTQADVDFAMELAHRAALAVENARLYRDVRTAVEIRDDFLAIAGHELKTPLAALLLHIQGLDRASQAGRLVATQLQLRLGKAATSGMRLEKLINEMLDVSRITAGRLHLELEDLDLDQLVREVAARFEEQAARAASPIAIHALVRVAGRWDRLRIDQVLSNLMSNAIKYGDGKPIDVELAVAAEQVIFRIVDRGIGIDASQHERIFERFERAVGAHEFGGLGLGLWISRQIVRASGGSIEVDSAPGRGSSFTVRLPLRYQEDEHVIH